MRRLMLAGAAALALTLAGAAPALAQQDEPATGPTSEACATATEQRDQHLDRAAHLRDKAASFDQQAAEHDANAKAADEKAAALDADAAAADQQATDAQAKADAADAQATEQQRIADEAAAAGDIETRDKAREKAAAARQERDEARTAAEQARQARDDLRQQASDARAERDDERAAAEKDRKQRDNRLAAAEQHDADAAAVDLSVCDEPATPECGEGEALVDGECVPETTDPAKCEAGQQLVDGECVTPGPDDGTEDCPEDGQVRNADGACMTPPAETPADDESPTGGDQDSSNVGLIHESGDWVWDGEQWLPIDHSTDNAPAPKGGVETGDGGTTKLAYTGVGDTLGWLAGGLGLVGVGALTLALTRPRALSRN